MCHYTKSNSHLYRKILCPNSALGYGNGQEATEPS